MGLADRDYTKRDSRGNINYKRDANIENFVQRSYTQSVKKRDLSLYSKIKNKIRRLLRLWNSGSVEYNFFKLQLNMRFQERMAWGLID